jgi:hypothetical protein
LKTKSCPKQEIAAKADEHVALARRLDSLAHDLDLELVAEPVPRAMSLRLTAFQPVAGSPSDVSDRVDHYVLTVDAKENHVRKSAQHFDTDDRAAKEAQ